jgi:hypothetical protein
MAALYNLKVKNTFIEIDDNDDTSSSLSFFDEEEGGGGIRRQVSEPAPSTTPLFATYKTMPNPVLDFFLEGSTTSKGPELSGILSPSSSERDIQINEPFQPESECEPDLGHFPNEMIREVTEEFCWSTSWQSDMEYACMNPLLGQAVPEPYQGEPLMHSYAAAALIGNEEVEENVPVQEYTASKKKRDTDAFAKANNGRRRKRESLIDQAARKQKLHSRQAKQASQQQRRQAASSAHSNVGAKKDGSKSQVARFCHRCGGNCQTHFKFCRFCGAEVLVTAP